MSQTGSGFQRPSRTSLPKHLLSTLLPGEEEEEATDRATEGEGDETFSSVWANFDVTQDSNARG